MILKGDLTQFKECSWHNLNSGEILQSLSSSLSRTMNIALVVCRGNGIIFGRILNYSR